MKDGTDAEVARAIVSVLRGDRRGQGEGNKGDKGAGRNTHLHHPKSLGLNRKDR
ncbi:MAG: hypothetical protein ACJ8C8_21715 [Microvirga sp.]